MAKNDVLIHSILHPGQTPKTDLIGRCIYGSDQWEQKKREVPGLSIPGERNPITGNRFKVGKLGLK